MDIVRYTIKQVEEMEEHAEMVGGELFIQNKTTISHNRAISEIATALRNHISSNDGRCEVFTENVALYVNELLNNDNNFFLPDIMVVCDNEKIDEKGVHVTPLFVAEITSEATRKNDYNTKLDVYKKIGVKEYWIVDLQRKTVYKYLASEDYIPQTFIYPKQIDVSVYEELSIDLSRFM
ncbi:MAG: Uma2 family endonuclease [Clostridium sp.]|nr:Uma2 family endonuclease [Clostridium sp.]